jgi:hypothetical protein
MTRRSAQGPIPDDHFENDPLPTTKEKPLSAEMQEWLEQMKKKQKEAKS